MRTKFSKLPFPHISSKENGHYGIKNLLEHKFAKSSGNKPLFPIYALMRKMQQKKYLRLELAIQLCPHFFLITLLSNFKGTKFLYHHIETIL